MVKVIQVLYFVVKSTTLTPPKTNMTIKHPPFEDAFPIENGGFSNVMLVFKGVCFGVQSE